MWNRLDSGLRTAIYRAVSCAEQRGDDRIATLHLLFGIGVAGDCAGAQLLSRLSVTDEAIASALNGLEAHESSQESESGLTVECRAAVDLSYTLARDMGDSTIGGEHLVLAFLRDPNSCGAGRLLSMLGVTWDTAAAELMTLQTWRTVPAPGIRIANLKRRRMFSGAKSKIRKLAYGIGLVVRYPREPYLRYMVNRTRIASNPYPYYGFLRREPFRWDHMIGQWFVTGYKEVQAVVQEPRFSTQQYSLATRNEAELPPLIDREFRSLDRSISMHVLFLDSPKQTRIRALVMKQFTPRIIAEMESQIQAIMDSLISKAVSKGRLNVIADIAVPLPGAVIDRLLGVSELRSSEFKRWSDAYIAYIGSESSLALDYEAYECLHLLKSYFREAIAVRRQEPQDDVLTLLMQAKDGNDCLTDEEIIANSLLMLAVGRETTTQFIGNMVLALLRHPDQWASLREDRSKIPAALEEVLRYDSPVQWTVRIAREAFEWQGRQIEKGHVLNIAIGSANRDPEQFEEPDRLDISRAENRHIAFGYGPHFCLGAALARLEGQVVLRTLLERFPNMALAQDHHQWRSNTTFRALKSLEVSLNV